MRERERNVNELEAARAEEEALRTQLYKAKDRTRQLEFNLNRFDAKMERIELRISSMLTGLKMELSCSYPRLPSEYNFMSLSSQAPVMELCTVLSEPADDHLASFLTPRERMTYFSTLALSLNVLHHGLCALACQHWVRDCVSPDSSHNSFFFPVPNGVRTGHSPSHASGSC
jgi:hypothetical protein